MMFIDIIVLCLGVIGILGGLLESLYFPYVYIGMLFLCIYTCIVYIEYYYRNMYIGRVIRLIVLAINIVMITCSFTLIRLLAEVIVADNFLRFNELFDLCGNNSIFYCLSVLLGIGIPFVHLLIKYKECKNNMIIILSYLCFIFIFILPVLVMHEFSIYPSYCFIVFIIYEMIFHIFNKRDLCLLKMVVLSLLCLVMVVCHITIFDVNRVNESYTDVLSDLRNKGKINNPNLNVLGSSSFLDGSLPDNDIRVNNEIAMIVESNKAFSGFIRGYSLHFYDYNQWVLLEQGFEDNTLNYAVDFQSINNKHTDSFRVNIIPRKKAIYDYTVYYSDTDYINNDSYYDNLIYPLKVYDIQYKFDYEDMPIDDYNYIMNYLRTYYLFNFYTEELFTLENKLKEYLNDNGIVNYYAGVCDRDEALYACERVSTILSNNNTYTLDCGPLGDNDFILNFLYNTKKGSCSHFASAGVMLLRAMGVPARYVKGYVVNESDFIDGIAVIREYRSHAWVEVYAKDYGWIPYEMTPSSYEESVSEVIDNNVSKKDPSIDITPIDSDTVNTDEFEDYNPKSNYDYKYILIIFIIILLIVLYRFITYTYYYKRLKKKKSNEQILILYRRLSKYNVDKDIYNLCMKARYSQYDINSDELLYMYDYYHTYMKDVYDKSHIINKMLMKVKGLC